MSRVDVGRKPGLLPGAGWWNGPLFRKAWAEGLLLLVCLAVLGVVFGTLFVRLTAKLDLGAFAFFLNRLPEDWKRMSSIPIETLTTPAGMVSGLFVHPLVTIPTFIWGITRGSASLSGELQRGSMELLVSQPVQRVAVVVTHGMATVLGAVVLALAVWLGVGGGVATAHQLPEATRQTLTPWLFLPPVVNLLAMNVCVCGLTTWVSACDRYRWRTIGLMCGFLILQIAFKIFAQMWPEADWLEYLTILAVYEPQILVVDPEGAWSQVLRDGSVLFGLGLLGYASAAFVFHRRDLPAPL